MQEDNSKIVDNDKTEKNTAVPDSSRSDCYVSSCLGFNHEFKEHYYGFQCKKCGHFVPDWFFDMPEDYL